MSTLTFSAENWIHDTVDATVKKNGNFVVQGYEFQILGTEELHNDELDVHLELTSVRSLAHSVDSDPIVVRRDLAPDRWSDGLYHATEGDIERTGKSVIEAISKIVAMCY